MNFAVFRYASKNKVTKSIISFITIDMMHNFKSRLKSSSDFKLHKIPMFFYVSFSPIISRVKDLFISFNTYKFTTFKMWVPRSSVQHISTKQRTRSYFLSTPINRFPTVLTWIKWYSSRLSKTIAVAIVSYFKLTLPSKNYFLLTKEAFSFNHSWSILY